MKAIGFLDAGDIGREEALIDLTLPEPVPGEHDLIVRVHAISVNPVDTKVRSGSQPQPGTPRILGYDAAGTVEHVGTQVTRFSPGDAVYYSGELGRPGTNAELHAVDERLVGPKPRSLDWAAAAALPLTTITAWEALFDRLDIARAVPGANAILIIGGAGGVGSIAIQLAKALTGLTVIATASRPETVTWVREMGADHVIDHRQPLAEAVAALGIGAPGFVFSTTHTGDHLAEIQTLIAPQGRLCLIDDPVSLDIVGMKAKNVAVHWEFMFGRSMFRTPDMNAQGRLLSRVSQMVDDSRIISTMTERLSPICAATLIEAHRRSESGATIGKLVIEGWA